MMRHLAANILTLLTVALVVLFGVVTWSKSQFRAPGPLTAPIEFEVARGEGLTSLADKLEAAGAITNASILRIWGRYEKLDQGLKFGDYSIPAGASMQDILELMNKGGNVIRQVVVPEGLTSWQVVELLRAEPDLSGEIGAIPPEGSLAPAGYDYQRGDDRQAILDRMTAAQTKILEAAWASREPGLPLSTPKELLTLASIVEKETGVPAERPMVASVFENRLKKGMRLQTDPTVIYGITKGQGPLGRGLRASELAAPTPYNTYAITGLPPTPIANPGKASIEAAAQPADSDFLYFVADGTGGHVFSRTLDEHNANVAAWRRVEAQKAAEERAAAAAAAAAGPVVEGAPGAAADGPAPRPATP